MSIFAVVALVASGAPAGLMHPLDPAIDGQLQCYHPDDIKRTCRSIAAYQRKADGTYANTATVLISSKGPVTLETLTPVTVKAGAVCGSIRAEDISKGKLRVANRLLSDSEAAPILVRIAQAMNAMTNKQICTSYEQSPTGIMARVTIDGVFRPDADQSVKWVRATEGYTVSP